MVKSRLLHLEKQSLFLDFFVLEYRWHTKHEILPKDFFTDTNIIKATKTEFGNVELCFFDNKVYISDRVDDSVIEKLIASNTNIVASVNTINHDGDSVFSKTIRNGASHVDRFSGLACTSFRSVSPYEFAVDSINSDQSVDVNFPNKYRETIRKGDTLGFYCKRMYRMDGEWCVPGVLLALFVKNYGFLDTIEILPEKDIRRIREQARFSIDTCKLRDFRKSSLLYELD